MYRLEFSRNKSKYFDDALEYAQELGAHYDGKTVSLEIHDELLLMAYQTMRTLFAYVQNWKNTRAYYDEIEVHPYQFILWMHKVGECADESTIDKRNCHINRNTFGWGCKKIDLISYIIKGDGDYKSNTKYWYNYGSFNNRKWVIDKPLIKRKLLGFVEKKGLKLCPVYDEINLIAAVDDLPDYIVPDGETYKIHYEETYLGGQLVSIPSNIRHVVKFNMDVEILDMSFEDSFLRKIEKK